MNNPTKQIILFGAICLVALLPLKYCNTPKQTDAKQHYIDSLLEVNKAKDVQIGFALAEAQTASDRAVKAELAAKQRDTVYLTRVKVIKQLAPDTCQPYLAAMKAECDTLQAKSDSTISALKNEVAAIDTVKEAYKSKSETLAHLNDVLTDENKELINDNKKLERKAKRGKIASWLIGGGLVALFLGTSLID